MKNFIREMAELYFFIAIMLIVLGGAVLTGYKLAHLLGLL